MLGREKNLTTSLEIPHAFSLFTPVSSTRSCASAHIPADYCVCHDTIRNLPNNDPHAHIAASVTVAHLNSILSNSSLCAKLHLYRVRNVQVERSLNMTVAISSPLEFWSVSLETIPGNGMFESTLRRRGEEDFEVIGTVSRTNLYRGQSECISDYHLRLYCYCIWEPEEKGMLSRSHAFFMFNSLANLVKSFQLALHLQKTSILLLRCKTFVMSLTKTQVRWSLQWPSNLPSSHLHFLQRLLKIYFEGMESTYQYHKTSRDTNGLHLEERLKIKENWIKMSFCFTGAV